MQHKHMLRVAAATTVTAFVSLGTLAPVHAAGERGADKPSTSQGKRPDAAPASKAQGPKSAPGSKAQGPKSAPGSKAQGPKSVPAPKPAPDHANGNASDKSANGNGHTPVTVCHRTGKAGYIVITFDENALEAHLAHGDLYPVPAGGCPTVEDTTGGSTDGDTTGGSDAGETPGTQPVETPGDNPAEAPAGADVAGGTTTRDAVLGVELTVSAGTAATAPAAATPAAVAPAAGVLPDTGAGEYLGATLAGLGLLGAGGVLLARRRAQQLG